MHEEACGPPGLEVGGLAAQPPARCSHSPQVIHCIENGIPLLIENLPEDLDPVLEPVIQRKVGGGRVDPALGGCSCRGRWKGAPACACQGRQTEAAACSRHWPDHPLPNKPPAGQPSSPHHSANAPLPLPLRCRSPDHQARSVAAAEDRRCRGGVRPALPALPGHQDLQPALPARDRGPDHARQLLRDREGAGGPAAGAGGGPRAQRPAGRLCAQGCVAGCTCRRRMQVPTRKRSLAGG